MYNETRYHVLPNSPCEKYQGPQGGTIPSSLLQNISKHIMMLLTVVCYKKCLICCERQIRLLYYCLQFNYEQGAMSIYSILQIAVIASL